MMKLNRAIFFRVKDNSKKAQVICHQVQDVLKKEKRLLMVTPNEEAAKYLDLLLWRLPEDSFIPHTLTQHPSNDWIVITTIESQNLNAAHCLFNLTANLSPIYHQFEEIYELYDETHPEKALLAQRKIRDYQAKGVTISEAH